MTTGSVDLDTLEAAIVQSGPRNDLIPRLLEAIGSARSIPFEQLERLLPEGLSAEEMDEVYLALEERGVEVLHGRPKPRKPPPAGPKHRAGAVAVEGRDSDPGPAAARPTPESEPRPTSVVAQYLADVESIGTLSADEEAAVAGRAAAGEERAINTLVESHLRLVLKVSSEYRHSGVHPMDLIQAGNIGLLDAAHHFRPGKATRFAQFASWWIRRAITRHIEATGLLIRLPRRLVKEVRALGRQRARLRGKLKREPSDLEVASSLDWPLSKVEYLSEAAHNPLSLDAPLPSDREKSFEDVVVDPKAPEQARNTRKRHVIASLMPYLEQLSRAEKSVLTLRYGLAGEVEHSVVEVSGLTSLSPDEVRRVEREGLRKLASLSASVLPAPFEDFD